MGFFKKHFNILMVSSSCILLAINYHNPLPMLPTTETSLFCFNELQRTPSKIISRDANNYVNK